MIAQAASSRRTATTSTPSPILADGELAPPVNNNASARGNLNSSVTAHDAAGRATKRIDENLHATSYVYDAAEGRERQ